MQEEPAPREEAATRTEEEEEEVQHPNQAAVVVVVVPCWLYGALNLDGVKMLMIAGGTPSRAS